MSITGVVIKGDTRSLDYYIIAHMANRTSPQAVTFIKTVQIMDSGPSTAA